MSKARAWLDHLEVDPIELRAHGVKGKKKLVELLDAYVRLLQVTDDDADRARIEARIREVTGVTRTDAYHDMLRVDDKVFKQDSTSYLRAAYLMEKLGLDTTRYREEIRRIHQRLDDHMARRGSHQRMAFHWYYQHFGLTEPFDLAAGYRAGVIASRLDPYRYRRTLQVYDLTHEIFVPYRFGEVLQSDFFSADDRAYLRHTLDRLTVFYVMARNPDLVAELTSCIRLLGFTDLAVYREAIGYLLEAQHEDGKWGDYERYRKKYGRYVDQGFYLHTTMVVLDALILGYRFPQQAP